jgi:hypothetical protein
VFDIFTNSVVIFGTYVLNKPILYNIGFDQDIVIFDLVELTDKFIGAGGFVTRF